MARRPDPRTVREYRGMPLGDVVHLDRYCVETVSRIRRHAPERLRTLLIHGFLHLLGYDHERSPSEARKMFARERKLAALMMH